MSEPFLAEIRMVGFNFAPRGWAFCDGQILPINQNQSLYSLLGTTYGGDGRTSFALPDLRGRAPIHTGDGNVLGSRGGEDRHALTPDEIPEHDHTANASASEGDSLLPAGNVLARRGAEPYRDATSLAAMAPSTVANAGSSQPHENMQPWLGIHFCIALRGLFPSRN